MDEVPALIIRSAEIVKKWGKTRLSNGKTLSEQLTFHGVSLWEVAAPDMALYQVPKALLKKNNYTSLLSQVRPHVSLAKREFLNFLKYNCDYHKSVGVTEKGVFLFLGFNSYMYHDVLSPIADRLGEDKGFKSIVIHDSQLNYLKPSNENINFRSIWEYYDSDLRIEARDLYNQVRAVVKELLDSNDIPKMIYLDKDMDWFQIEVAFNLLFKFHFPLLIPQIVIARHILTKNSPSIVISADGADLRMRTYGFLAHQMDIPVLEVQFGPGGAESTELQFLVADHIAAWGNRSREVLIEHGVSSEMITITGSPRHDDLVNVHPLEIEKTRKRFKVPEGYKMVLCASTYRLKEYDSFSDPDLLLSMKRAVFRAAREVDRIFLVVKPHPLENVKETMKLVGKSQNIIIVSVREDIRELIKACDAYVGFGSITTVDALIANKITVCPIFKGWVWSEPFEKSNSTWVLRSESEIIECFQKIVDVPSIDILKNFRSSKQSYLHDLAFKIDGKSSERVVETAIKMIAKKNFTNDRVL